jgi:SOS response regulatory protein OraA/RecX
MRAALQSKGISDDIIESALHNYGPDESEIILSDLIKRLGPEGQIPDRADPAYQKLVLSYQRRGFRFSDIREAFSHYSDNGYDL